MTGIRLPVIENTATTGACHRHRKFGSCLWADVSGPALCCPGNSGVCILGDNAKAQISGSGQRHLGGVDRLGQSGIDKLTRWIGFTNDVGFTIRHRCYKRHRFPPKNQPACHMADLPFHIALLRRGNHFCRTRFGYVLCHTREEDRADLFGDCWPVQAKVMLMRQHGS